MELTLVFLPNFLKTIFKQNVALPFCHYHQTYVGIFYAYCGLNNGAHAHAHTHAHVHTPTQKHTQEETGRERQKLFFSGKKSIFFSSGNINWIACFACFLLNRSLFDVFSKVQFHQHFTSTFFVQKSFVQLLCAYSLGL